MVATENAAGASETGGYEEEGAGAAATRAESGARGQRGFCGLGCWGDWAVAL